MASDVFKRAMGSTITNAQHTKAAIKCAETTTGHTKTVNTRELKRCPARFERERWPKFMREVELKGTGGRDGISNTWGGCSSGRLISTDAASEVGTGDRGRLE